MERVAGREQTRFSKHRGKQTDMNAELMTRIELLPSPHSAKIIVRTVEAESQLESFSIALFTRHKLARVRPGLVSVV